MSSATLAEPRTGTSTRPDTRRDSRPDTGRDTRGDTRPDTGRDAGRDAARRAGTSTHPAGRATVTTTDTRSGGTAPFVLLIMVLLTGGLVATLWLSTAAAADSYRLDEARQVARDLSEQTERLHRDVAAAQSAPALAAAARAQGMVPAGEPAVLLVAPDGSSQVIGDARPAQALAPPPVPAAPVGPAQSSTAAQAATDGQPAPAPAGAAAAEDQLAAVPSRTADAQNAQNADAQNTDAQNTDAQNTDVQGAQNADAQNAQDTPDADAAPTPAGR
ncbi:hypothetical protein PHK61_19105 [Actinomycetospora lutea]|uniref:hypothetical protein n=1 Tax=Actinomycetospora lutea TaxID=663604 RepID=UPI002365ACBC|nr:hypothetical protein [Actinomycetospora lutea]MDD7940536.1 hypothetical protein [Actinomycetospora lutea]